ncbi:unnamed protein product [Lepeophtheirus salmonis]|uniref:(salmon louse) hypothetical protein n=1 Tax=Lepeophtheirus salmonis TaxID=72036 RepID=A0A7R8CWZ0_LEPSM|nr:unnamed protein product [Lepeophtheirus salmonis]CAF2956128.1 unnamed protein product [Lepeophtheirus salmonis]
MMEEKCDVGKMLKQQCHKLDFSRTKGMLSMTHLHPNVLTGDRVISLEMSQLLKERGHNVVPGQKFCRTCIKHYKTISQPTEMYVPALETEDELNFDIFERPRRKVNLSLEAAGVSPIHLHAIPQHARLLAAKVKLSHKANGKILVDAMNWDYTYKNLMEKLVCSTDNRMYMMHRCDHCLGSDALRV